MDALPIDIEKIEELYIICPNGKIFHKNNGQIVNCHITTKGYTKAYFRGTGKSFSIHRIICAKFHPNSDATKLQVNHIDGNKLNNNASNLEWVTNKENTLHAIHTGLRDHLNHSGENNPSHKISENDAKNIVKKLLKHELIYDIAKFYNINSTTVSAIKNKKLWVHLTKGVCFDMDYKRVSRSKLSPDDVKTIIALLLEGKKYAEIASLTGYSKHIIQDIKLKHTWKSLTQDILFSK